MYFKEKIQLPQIILSVLIITAIMAAYNNQVLFTHANQYGVFPNLNSNLNIPFNFENKSHLLQLNPYHKKSFWGREPRYTVVADINNDNFEDIILIAREAENRKSTKLQILINNGGINFSNQTSIWYSPPKRLVPSAAAVADLDNDGHRDLIVSFDNGEVFFYKNLTTSFSRNSHWKKYISMGDKRSISLADFNNDGFLDIYFGSYLNINFESIISTSYNSSAGGMNSLLINRQGKYFEDQTHQFHANDTRYTWTSAIADYDNDGFVDILNANDFGRNVFLANKSGQRFEVKNHYLNEMTDSFNMSGEVLDINNNNVPDVYISNTNKFPLLSGNNRLLELSDGQFKNSAKELGIDSCGWSWGVKSFDPELNNNLALFVVTSPNWSENQNFRINYFSAPAFVKGYFGEFLAKKLSRDFYRYDMSVNQRYCVFYRQNDQYVDISKIINVPVGEGGRSIAEMDFNLDGNSDFIISNSKKTATLLQGKYTGKNNWLSINLIGTKSNKDAIGAKISAYIGEKEFHRYLFPTNGYHSQSSKFIKFGIPSEIKNITLVISWPSGINQEIKFESTEFNKLHSIFER